MILYKETHSSRIFKFTLCDTSRRNIICSWLEKATQVINQTVCVCLFWELSSVSLYSSKFVSFLNTNLWSLLFDNAPKTLRMCDNNFHTHRNFDWQTQMSRTYHKFTFLLFQVIGVDLRGTLSQNTPFPFARILSTYQESRTNV